MGEDRFGDAECFLECNELVDGRRRGCQVAIGRICESRSYKQD